MIPFFGASPRYDDHSLYKKKEGEAPVTEDVLCDGLFIRAKSRITNWNAVTKKLYSLPYMEGYVSKLVFDSSEKHYSFKLRTEENKIHQLRYTSQQLEDDYWYDVAKTRQGIIDEFLAQ